MGAQGGLGTVLFAQSSSRIPRWEDCASNQDPPIRWRTRLRALRSITLELARPTELVGRTPHGYNAEGLDQNTEGEGEGVQGGLYTGPLHPNFGE